MKDEFKETEGNPVVKSRIRRLQRQARRRRMLKEVERAAVVITNPTEFAIALEYRTDMAAPVVVAKGRNLLAAQIKEIARWQGIPMVENPPLAHALYRAVEVGQSDSGETVCRGRGDSGGHLAGASARPGAAGATAADGRRRPPSRSPSASRPFRMDHAGGGGRPGLCHAGAACRAWLLDLLLAMSITASVLVLLSAIQILRPSQFSVFPACCYC